MIGFYINTFFMVWEKEKKAFGVFTGKSIINEQGKIITTILNFMRKKSCLCRHFLFCMHIFCGNIQFYWQQWAHMPFLIILYTDMPITTQNGAKNILDGTGIITWGRIRIRIGVLFCLLLTIFSEQGKKWLTNS